MRIVSNAKVDLKALSPPLSNHKLQLLSSHYLFQLLYCWIFSAALPVPGRSCASPHHVERFMPQASSLSWSSWSLSDTWYLFHRSPRPPESAVMLSFPSVPIVSDDLSLRVPLPFIFTFPTLLFSHFHFRRPSFTSITYRPRSSTLIFPERVYKDSSEDL